MKGIEKAAKKVDAAMVRYHDSFHLERVLHIHEEPLKLMESVAAYELLEMKDGDECRGMSRAFGVRYGNLSIPIMRQTGNSIEKTGAGIISWGCPGCLVPFQGGIEQQAPDRKMKHVTELIALNIRNLAVISCRSRE